MKWLSYIVAWYLAISGAGKFVSLCLMPFMNDINVYFALFVISGSSLLVLALLGVRIVSWVKAGRVFMPDSFSGWRYKIVIVAILLSIFSMLFSVFMAFTMVAPSFSLFLFGSILCLVAMVATEMAERNRLKIKA